MRLGGKLIFPAKSQPRSWKKRVSYSPSRRQSKRLTFLRQSCRAEQAQQVAQADGSLAAPASRGLARVLNDRFLESARTAQSRFSTFRLGQGSANCGQPQRVSHERLLLEANDWRAYIKRRTLSQCNRDIAQMSTSFAILG
jgi:hypothetical protein